MKEGSFLLVRTLARFGSVVAAHRDLKCRVSFLLPGLLLVYECWRSSVCGL